MAVVSSVFNERWWSAQHVGPAKPEQIIKVRKGHFARSYNNDYDWPDVNAKIVGGNNSAPWQATWIPDTPYVVVPNDLEVSFVQSLEQNGITTATITIENIIYPELTGPAGIYHVIKRGYLAPYRGYSRLPYPEWQAEQNEWAELLNRNAQITIWQGYGLDEMPPTFTGLIDDVDLTSHPDRIVVTARDMGQTLTDQEVFGYVKDPAIHDPITFIDRLQADNVKKVGYDPTAGTEDDSAHAATMVVDTDPSTLWRSRSYSGPNATDWVEIHLPQGRYASFFLWNAFPDLAGYLSIYVRPRDDGRDCTFDGTVVADDSWVDIGLGDVPGALGGVPFVKEWNNMPDDRGYTHTLGYNATNMPKELICGDGSVLRMHFRDLHEVHPDNFYAGVRRMIALKRSISDEARKGHYIAVDDVADIVRVVLRWAGFKEWEVENGGVRLSKPWVVDRSMFLMDIIKKVMENTDFLFYMGDPRDPDGEDLGIPIFRHLSAAREETPVIEVDEQHLLTGIQVKLTEQPLATIIRMRGATLTNDLNDNNDRHHVNFTYHPPWADRMAGILKHVVHFDSQFKTTEDCQFACLYTALQEALQSATGTIQIPANPGVEIDHFAGLFDEGTGLATRIWVSNRSSTFRTGEQASWTMTLGGALVDVPDVQDVVRDINEAVRSGEP